MSNQAKHKGNRSSKDLSGHPFQRLQSELAELIASVPAGQKLPTEPELARQMGASRATLREAMRTFEGQGLIRRRQGVGTFVVSHAHIIESGLEVLQSIETLAGKIGLMVSMGELSVNRVTATNDHIKLLNVPAGTALVEVARLILADGRPVAYLIDVLPEDILTPEDLQVGFTGSVLDFLQRRGTPQLANSLAEIQAVAATPDLARSFEIQRNDVLLKMTAQLFAVSGVVIDYSISYFLPGYFRFHVVRRVGA